MTRDSSGLSGPRKRPGSGRSAGGLSGRRPKYTPEPDPLASVEYTGKLAEDAAAEFTALEHGYRNRAKAESDRFKRATDNEYWFAVCFDSREEKERFLERAGLIAHGDKYLDGRFVADSLGVNLD
ncbi:hypothetical protein PTQ19_10300 [Microbacterium esteraromaticum]|uniref:hypothetical protein n=1 Tax=Microbacterium esteraromaticum TaxID=57043 RepID=UPI002367AB60|nr:hypothetical protein [Microbacterium esteraromaticum]WDH77912.1 hypothetical protein PTQ19_10300 [Microbacterium esteraromaticum]